MKDWEIRKENFLDEINEVLSPVLMINDRPRDTFSCELCETPYAMTDQVIVEDAMGELIERLAMKHFNQKPHYNNTHRSFWFINVDV